MICYRCGCRLSEKDFCTGCGADVGIYKHILARSNRLYNDGLEKASVRDLSGAIDCLRQSLKFNKNNIDARNLLGLVYFEMGEVVEALGQWVISKNIRPKKNVADDYLNVVQSSQARLDDLNQSIKKYNQALKYCYEESNDLAIIQLKKVLSVNAKYVKAHQLLALLYISQEEWEKAQKELTKILSIDKGNTLAYTYLKDVEHMLIPEEGIRGGKRQHRKEEEIIRYQSGNETIIQPVNFKDHRGVNSLLNLGIGVLIGVAIACFLILPGRIQSARAEINKNLVEVGEQLDAKNTDIADLQQKYDRVSEEKERLSEELAKFKGTEGSLLETDALMMAVSTYLTDEQDVETIAGYMEKIEESIKTETNTDSYDILYSKFMELEGDALAKYYYDKGYDFYKAENYEEAIPDLKRAYEYNPENGDALFYLANAYRRNGNLDEAKEHYALVIDYFPDTEKAGKAETYLQEISQSD